MTATHLVKLCVALGALHAGVATAALAWDNGAPASLIPGVIPDSSNLSELRQAEDFTLSTTSNLTSVTFWTLESQAADFTGSIFYEILGDAVGAPGVTSFGSGLASVTRTAAGSAGGFDQFQNDMALSVTNLAAGTYWLALHNGPLASTNFTDFAWSWTGLNAVNTPTSRGQEFSLNPLAVAWNTNDAEHAFSVYADAVVINPGLPEPATWLLIGAGVAALVRRPRRAVL